MLEVNNIFILFKNRKDSKKEPLFKLIKEKLYELEVIK